MWINVFRLPDDERGYVINGNRYTYNEVCKHNEEEAKNYLANDFDDDPWFTTCQNFSIEAEDKSLELIHLSCYGRSCVDYGNKEKYPHKIYPFDLLPFMDNGAMWRDLAWLDGKFYIVEWNDGDEVRNFTDMFVYDKDKVLSLMRKKRPYSAYVSVENDEVYICMEFDGDNNVYRHKTKFREADLFTPENLWDKLD